VGLTATDAATSSTTVARPTTEALAIRASTVWNCPATALNFNRWDNPDKTGEII
jgi:hypothetical protein